MWSSLIRSLDDDSRRRLQSVLTAKSCDRGRFLYREGDPGDSLFIIGTGHLLVERVSADGDVVAVGVLGPDDIVGEQALVSDAPRVASVRAVTAVDGWLLHRGAFDSARREHRALDRLLVEILDQRVRHLLELVNEARHVAAEERLRQRLIDLCDRFDGEIPLTQEAVATMAGTTRPTANSYLRRLRRDGAVELRRGHITVVHRDRI